MNLPTIKNDNRILEAKAKKSLERLIKYTREGTSIQEHKVVHSIFKYIKDIYTSPTKPITLLFLAEGLTPIYSTNLEDNYQGLYEDLSIIYDEIISLGNAQVRNYNYSESRHKSLSNRVSKLSNKLDTTIAKLDLSSNYNLFVEDFKDMGSFNQGKLTGEVSRAYVAAEDGYLSLNPSYYSNAVNIDTVQVINMIGLPSFDSKTQTGGFEGLLYNTELRYRAADILNFATNNIGILDISEASVGDTQTYRKLMLDGNPDTFWECEYTIKDDKVGEDVSLIKTESVDLLKDPTDLNIDFTVDLSEVKEFSWISINPNTFGKSTILDIIGISTSVSGEIDSFESINSSFQQGLATSITSDDSIGSSLSLENTKYSGQAVFSFSPREAKYIRFKLRQRFPYKQVYDILEVLSASSRYAKYIDLDITAKTKRQELLYLQSEREIIDVRTDLVSGGSITSTIPTATIESLKLLAKSSTKGTTLDIVLTSGSESTTINDIALTWQEDEHIIPVKWSHGGTITITAKNNTKEVGTADVTIISLVAATSSIDELTQSNTTLPLVNSEDTVRNLKYLESIISLQKTPESLIHVMKDIGATDVSNYVYKRKDDILRYAIGVRSIDIFSYKFDVSSEYVSKGIPTEDKIMSLSLTSEEVVPQAFIDYSPASRGDYIKYYVSVDKGTSWSRLLPKTAQDVYQGSDLVPKIIYINSEVAKEQRRNALAYIDASFDIYDVLVRVLISRPSLTSFESHTPLLKKYTLFIETEEV